MKLYAQISKIDEEQRMVWGYATTGARDSQGEIVAPEAVAAAWDDYMKFANIREMHQPSAVGVVKEYTFDSTGVLIGAEVVDDTAWEKVKKEVYKGFSIGGKKLPGGYDALTKTITALQITEISLVDRPANPESLITMYKLADQPEGENAMSEQAGKQPVDELLDMLSKGTVPAERLLELAQGLEKGLTVTVSVDTQDQNDQSQINPDAATGGNAASVQNPTPGVKATEATPTDGSGSAPKATETDPSDPNSASNLLNKPNNPNLTVTGKSVGLSPLRKSVHALVAKGDDVKKGLWSVSDLAQLVNSLRWVTEDAAWEREAEGDASTVPDQLAACVQALGAALVAMVTEEVAELVAALPAGTAPLDALTAVIANSEAAPVLTKWNEALDVVKEGKRNSAADQDRVQKAHDLMAELGAECSATAKGEGTHDHGTDLKKDGAQDNDLAKMASTVEKMATDLGKMRDDLTKAHTTIADLQKQVAKSPSVPKGQLHVVEKSAEANGGLATEVTVEPVLKGDGTVDDLATAIKKVHVGGGRLVLGQR